MVPPFYAYVGLFLNLAPLKDCQPIKLSQKNVIAESIKVYEDYNSACISHGPRAGQPA